jgi:DDE superfamily endonuclease
LCFNPDMRVRAAGIGQAMLHGIVWGMPTSPRAELSTFRELACATFERRRDTLFELSDSLLVAGPISSLAHLSLESSHRRGWGSLYDALAAGRIREEAVRALVADLPLVDGEPIYAVDTSVWARCDAETSPQRAFYYHPSRHSAGQPIVAGWAYQWIAQMSFARDSWTAPVDVERLLPGHDSNTLAAEQIRRLLIHRGAKSVPLFVFDAGYDPIQLALDLGELNERSVAVLVRLRRNRCFYADPDPATAAATGRPRRHGHKFACRDMATWPAPSDEYYSEDVQYGHVQVCAWANLHAIPQNHATKGSRGPKPVVSGTLIRVEVSRLPQHTREPQVLWLWWRGPGTPDLAVIWRAYVRRFDLEHTFRFLKQTLNWTTPRVRQPGQADRWTWLVLLAYTQLRLARTLVADARLPWEHPLPPGQLTPSRVRRAFSSLLLTLDTPAKPPKPCGRSPGRPQGRRSGPAPRYPAVKTTA